MFLNPAALVLGIILAAIIVAVLLGAAHGFMGQFRGVSAWATATLIQATGWIIFGTLRGVAPELFVIMAGNGLIHFSLARYLIIVAEFEGKPVRAWWAYSIVLAMLLGFVYFTLVSPNVATRMGIASVSGATLTLMSARVLTSGPEVRPRSHWFSASAFAVCGFFLAFRAGYYFLWNTDPSYPQFAANAMNGASFVVFLATLVLLNVGFLAMLSDRYSRERAEALAALEQSLLEEERLVQAGHDRAEDNLRTIQSLRTLHHANRREADTRTELRDVQMRLRSVLSVNETAYRTGHHTRISLPGYLTKVASNLFEAQDQGSAAVRLALALEPAEVETRQAIICGLVVNELVNDSLKQALTGSRPGELRIALRQDSNHRVWLSVSDTRSGHPGFFARENGDSLGLQLISDLARQLAGKLDLGPGATLTLSFAPSSDDPPA